MVSCSWSEERFERFLDGELSAGDRARLLQHVDGCDGCRGLFEELRVVDALLLAPRTVALPENFTRATMAELGELPRPCARRATVLATIVAYVAGAWSLVGASFLIVPQHTLAFVYEALAMGNTILGAFGGLLHTFWHFGDRGDVSNWTTVAGGVIIADLLVLSTVVAVRVLRPRMWGRLRW